VISLAALLVPGVPWSHRAVLVAALVAPLPTALLIFVLVLRRDRSADRGVVGPEAATLLEVVASLQAGRTFRTALAGMSAEVERLVEVGASTESLAGSVRRALPEQGRMAAAAVRLLDVAGGPAAPVMEELATQATETARVQRELRSAVAAPVLQGVIVGGAPLAMLFYLIFSGGFAENLAVSPAHAITVSVGAVLTVIGVCWVVVIVRGSTP
jgi:Flp pilus assembly protein TadB